jgi:hypothetical protein
MSQNRVVVRLRHGYSDGDPLHVPKQGSNYTQVVPPTLYLEKTADQWMERQGKAQLGAKYILEALPNGYTMWQRPRPSDPNHVDKYLYGHPGHKYFDSPNRFYPHFEYLMDNNGNSIGCPCKVCAGSAPRSSSTASSGAMTPVVRKPAAIPSRPSQVSAARSQTAADALNTVSSSRPTQVPTRPQVGGATSSRSSLAPAVQGPPAPSNEPPKGRPKIIGPGMDMTRVDLEGTPDVYRNLIDKLKRYTTIDEIIEEPLSPDWRAEQKVLPGMLQSVRQQAQWIPRSGDIVLFIRRLSSDVEILRHESTGEFQIYDEETEEFMGTPQWEAGLIAEVPTVPASVADLHRSESNTNVIYSGVRVEPLPDPNGSDKSISKQYDYFPLRQTRPFLLWKELLHEVPQAQWHPTVINALTLTSTVSVFARYRFRGTWPAAVTYCHGMHLGSEMLVVGDTVRLLPSANKLQTRCVDILVIKSIRLKWSNMDKASVNDYDEGRPYTSEIYVYGSAYTSDPLATNKEYLSEDNVEPPKAAASYGEWYPLHPASKELAIPYTRILGRMHEQDAMSFWLNSGPDDRPTLDCGREGLYEARVFARNNDQRITSSPGATWWWGDDRADALNLRTINGLDVSRYDPKRDIRALRKNIKVLDGLENAKPRSKPTGPPSFGNRDLRRFMAPGTTTLPDRSHGIQDLSMSDSTGRSSPNSDEIPSSSKKRSHITINLSDDEEEAEYRQHTKIIDNVVGASKKKSKVAVIIKGN